MELRELRPAKGSHQVRNRIGHGTSSGNRKIAGHGQKRQKTRSDGGVCLGFEGGQTPLFRRLPKRGFTSVNRKNYAVINFDVLNHFGDRAEVVPVALIGARVVRNEKAGIKVLANGGLNKELTVKAAKFSKAAQGVIEAAGGPIEVI